MKPSAPIRHFAKLAASAALLLPMSALAQTAQESAQIAPNAQDDSSSADGDIVVTAQLRSQSLQDVPIAVSAVTEAALEASGVKSVQDLQLVSPAITFSQSTDSLNAAVRIRGVGTQVFSISIEPSVSFVVDGVVLARTASALTDLVDIERVEVLRGPQSTLFGKNSSAGVVSVITKDPSKSFEGMAYASIESDESVTLRGSVSGPLSDTAGIRLTGYYTDVVGHIDNVFDGRKLNGSTNYGVRGKLKFEPTSNLSFTIAGDYRKSDSDCCQYQLEAVSNAAYANVVAPVIPSRSNTKANINAPVYTNSEDWGVSLNAELGLGNAKLTSITAYRGWTNERNADIDSTPLAGPLPGINLMDRNGADTSFKTFTQELRLNGEAFDRLDYVIGAFYSNFKLDTDFQRISRTCTVAGPGGSCATATTTPTNFIANFEESNYSVFADGTFHISDSFEAFGGARLAFNEQSARYVRFGGSPLGPLQDSENSSATMGRAGLRYVVNPDLSFYASYSRGYKFGSYDLTSGLTVAQFARQPIAPETANAYEVGMRSELFDRDLIVNLTAFRTDYSNFQAQSYDPALQQMTLVSAGTARTQGAELEVTAKPVSALSLSGGLSYTDAKFRSFPDGPCYVSVALPATCRLGPGGVRLQDLSGFALPNSPKWKLVLSGRYDIVTSQPFDLFLSASSVSQSSVIFALNHNPRTEQGGFTTVNLNFGIQSKDASKVLTLYVRNLFNTNYATLISESSVGDTRGISHFLPREAATIYGASLKVAF
jgi:iron complex outermembrane receptor protein